MSRVMKNTDICYFLRFQSYIFSTPGLSVPTVDVVEVVVEVLVVVVEVDVI